MVIKLLIINLLTLIRVIGTIILVPIYSAYGGYYVSLLALVCYLTDSIDGILARKFKACTFFGSLFDGAADKLFTIMNFIVLYLITPYAIIPIVIELLIVLVQIMKYNYNYNVQSNMVGKVKTWILAICVILTFFVSDITKATFLPFELRDWIIKVSSGSLYFWLLTPAIVMEFLTLISYIREIFTENNQSKGENNNKSSSSKVSWSDFKNVWLNPEYYDEHKNDVNIKKVTKISKK